jgi:hypothetical protein
MSRKAGNSAVPPDVFGMSLVGKRDPKATTADSARSALRSTSTIISNVLNVHYLGKRGERCVNVLQSLEH